MFRSFCVPAFGSCVTYGKTTPSPLFSFSADVEHRALLLQKETCCSPLKRNTLLVCFCPGQSSDPVFFRKRDQGS